MRVRAVSLFVLATAVLAGACKDGSSPVSHSPTHFIIISGADQSGDASTALAQPLVVQALDGVKKPVANVPVTWTVTGGGSVSSASTATGSDGKATATWTLAPTAGVQVVTVTSSAISSASVSFVASNGATISGTVTPAASLPFGPIFSRTSALRSTFARSTSPTVTQRPSLNRIVVGFKNDALGVAAIGASANRTMAAARSTATRMQQRITGFSVANRLSHAELSPSIFAARLKVDDPTQVDAVMAAIRADPSVAWVERDQIVSIRDGAPHALPANLPVQGAAASPMAPGDARGLASRLPNDPIFWEQSWGANMIDLPHAWSITTGSSNVLVASVDMGIRFDHPEIAANLTSDGYDFVSQAAFDAAQPLCDGGTFQTIDGDGDGPDADPTDPDDVEFDGFSGCWFHSPVGDHGLWTAGIIGAAGNDGQGIAGVSWNVKIRPIRVLGITGQGTNFDIAQGVLYAAGLPAAGAGGNPVQAPSRAQIINISLGGDFPSTTLGDAVAAAIAAGSLVVASAGNEGFHDPVYPAAYPGVMAVAAVGMDGNLATYSNAGTYISVSAPGGDFRLDENFGGAVLGPGWDFDAKVPVYLLGYGTSASAPYVSGVAALLLAQNPALTAAQLRSRIEQFATRPAGLGRSDTFGWGIVNAYNALTQQSGPTRVTLARLIDATTGTIVKTVNVGANGNFVFSRLANGSYYVQAGDDESGDALLGVPGRRFGWIGGGSKPTVFNVNGNSQSTSLALGLPTEVEPNDDVGHANLLSVGSYVIGNVTTPDTRDIYSVTIPTAGIYTFETSGVVGTCGLGIELDTSLQLVNSAGTSVATNDNFTSPTGRFCSRIQTNLTPGIYYVTLTPSASAVAARRTSHGRYRLEVRPGN